MTTKTSLLSPLLAIWLLGTGCLHDAFDAESTEEGTELDEVAASTRQWQPLYEGCATSITVAPNDVVWVTGCDGDADPSVWYMRYEVECYEGICADVPVWYDSTGSGNHVAINRAGDAMAVPTASTGRPGGGRTCFRGRRCA